MLVDNLFSYNKIAFSDWVTKKASNETNLIPEPEIPAALTPKLAIPGQACNLSPWDASKCYPFVALSKYMLQRMVKQSVYRPE